MKKLVSALCVICLCLSGIQLAHAFWSYYVYPDHQDITKMALGAPNTFIFGGNKYSFSNFAIDQINAIHKLADSPEEYWALNHFDSDSLVGSLQELGFRRRQLNRLLGNTVPAQNPPAIPAAMNGKEWELLGYMLHAIEDFYSHSSWVDEHNTDIIGFGTLTDSTSTVLTPPYSFTASLQGNLCPSVGFPLFAPVADLVTGYYPPAITPSGACIHGNIILTGDSCLESLMQLGFGVTVPGISHDIPCAYLSTANTMHVAAKSLAVQEVYSFVQSIVADLNGAQDSAGFCALLGLDDSTPICAHRIGVTVTGLSGGGSVTLQDNGSDNLTISVNNTLYNFASPIPSGSPYSVTVLDSPPGQMCAVTNASGIVASADIGGISVSCSNDAYNIGVTVTGLSNGEGVTLQDNGHDNLTVSSNGRPTNFATPIPNGSTYRVTILTQPPGQICTTSNGGGMVVGANVNVSVTCHGNALTTTAAVSAGGDHACALSSSGVVYCWGSNISSQLGNGTFGDTPVTSPVQVTGLSGVTAISAGLAHTCAIAGEGTAWCWGDDNDYDLGSGKVINVDGSVPLPVVDQGGTSPLNGVAAISAGGASSCAVLTSGSVLCWGSNLQGQLGDGEQEIRSAVPVAVSNLSGIVAVSVGYEHACALTNTGTVWCWGDDNFGELGDGNPNTLSFAPIVVPGLPSGVVSISAGYYATCAVTNTGAAWCWGYDIFGELGVGPIENEYTSPHPVLGLALGATAISAGSSQTCAQIGDGMQCWGEQALGLGTGVVPTSAVPATVVNPAGTGPLTGVASMSAGSQFTCALTSTGGVDCWGSNSFGQLGNGTTTSLDTNKHSSPPAPVVGVGGSGVLQL